MQHLYLAVVVEDKRRLKGLAVETPFYHKIRVSQVWGFWIDQHDVKLNWPAVGHPEPSFGDSLVKGFAVLLYDHIMLSSMRDIVKIQLDKR